MTGTAEPGRVGDRDGHARHEDACAAALVELAGMTPVRLARILDGMGPSVAWAALAAGTHPADRARRFRGEAAGTAPEAVAERYRAAGVAVLLPGRLGYPGALEGDPGAPAVLGALGHPGVLDGRPAVAVVGTRSATPYGARVAADLGHDLAAAGAVVVSGLARGIDGAAHRGALRAAAAPPVAVAGTGLTCPYPERHRALWEAVAEAGAVLSEAPLAAPPRPGGFPARNRIIAALADVVVVVECHARGGSLHTVEAAARRAIPVLAVPGSVHSRASDGANALLVDGCAPVRDAADVLAAVALARAARGRPAVGAAEREPNRVGDRAAGRAAVPGGPGTAPSDRLERAVLDAVKAQLDPDRILNPGALGLGVDGRA